MRIFISAPYSKGDVAQNVHNAIHAADYVSRLGHFPYNPLMTHFWHMLIPHEYEFWMAQDEEWLKFCDAILRLPGESAGADREVQIASDLGLVVYGSVFDIPKA